MTIGLFIKENRVLKEINSVTFSVYLSHCFVMFIVNDKIAQAGIISISKSYAIRFVSVYTITISMCLIYKRLKNCLPSKITVLK
ncbi:hypothetical protein SDC9_211803 [bioreactor metagenome]|uniref:Uncharacterized protein n=1 Tax=bioreactor metagenome TaxID=1076179 RepID=A0A645JL91_9ZZZZ